jgi:DNA-directed RNA polymerase specialized sigma54-like protein
MLAGAPSTQLPDDLPQRRELLRLVTQDWKVAREILLRTTAVKQSPTQGDPAGLDATAWLKAVEAFRADNLTVGATRVRSGIRATLSAACDALDQVIREASALLERLAHQLDELEPDAEAQAFSETFRSAVDAVGYASVDVGDLTELRNQAHGVSNLDLPALRTVVADAAASRNRDQALRFQSRAGWRDATILIACVDAATAMIETAAHSLPVSGGQTNSNSEYDVGPSATACRAALIELADILAELNT